MAVKNWTMVEKLAYSELEKIGFRRSLEMLCVIFISKKERHVRDAKVSESRPRDVQRSRIVPPLGDQVKVKKETVMNRLSSILFISVAILVGAIVDCAKAARPNVLIILLDDMGYGDPGCYNPESKITTPNIDQLAAEGMRFTDGHTAGSVCVPSRFSLLTGQYPGRGQNSIVAGTPTIASMLKENGYATAMVGKWHNGFEHVNWRGRVGGGPLGCGFESFLGLPHSLDIQPYLLIEDDRVVEPPTEKIAEGKVVTRGRYDETGWNDVQGAFWRAGERAPSFQHEKILDLFTERAIEFLDQRGKARDDRPFFLYLAYSGPHTPWLPSQEYVGKSGAGLYGDFLMQIDRDIGRVVAALEKNGFGRDTLLLLSSDNGPVWYGKDRERFEHDSAGDLNGAKGGVYEAGHRVPFIVRWPGTVQAGSVCDQLVALTDVMATLSSILGKPLPEGVGRDSIDFLPLLRGEPGATRQIMPHLGRPTSLRYKNYKYLDGQGGAGLLKVSRGNPGDSPVQLYDLSIDPGERRNIADQLPEIVQQLKQELKNRE